MLVDSHLHLDFPDFTDERAAIIERARAAGVTTLLTISTHVSRFATLTALAEAHPDVWCSVGTHPHNAAEEPDIAPERLVALSAHPRCVAIGEAGLDFHYDKSPRDVQERVFRAHIEAARESGLPLVVHARDADERMIAILTQETARGPFAAILHCFSSGEALARTGLDLGVTISFSGILTFKRSEEIRRIASLVPPDRLLVETDAPYLAPEPHRGKRNEPAYVALTCAALARVHGVAPDEMAAITSANFFRLFHKARPAAAVEAAA